MLFTSPPANFTLPSKIISLVPSITELLWYLGLEKETIGITKFCVHPRTWLHEKQRIGGTKNLHVEEIISLNPDLVIASREENVKEQVEAIAKHVPVFLTDVVTLEDAYQMISDIGQLTGRDKRADELIRAIREKFLTCANISTIKRSNHPTSRPAGTNHPTIQPPGLPGPTIPTIYLIWKDPYMTVGGDTFISNMMKVAGFRNVFESQNRYPEISVEELKNSETDLIMLSSEPYPFKQTHVEELASLLPDKRIFLVDGEMFSWYGSRMLHAAKYFFNLRNELAG